MAQGQLVWLHLHFPRGFADENVVLRARRDQTWNQMFNEHFGVLMPDDFRVSNYRYRRGQQGNNRGYCGRRNDTISDFLNSFRRRQDLYNATVFSSRERRGRRARNPQGGNGQLLLQAGHAQQGGNPRRGINPQIANPPPVVFRDLVRDRLANFESRFLQRVQVEITALQNHGSWMRNVLMAPLTSMFISEILRRD